MAQQKFHNSFREALWETYGKKCFHCAGELLLADMRVDHIVPEHLHHGEAEKRAAVLKEIGLPLEKEGTSYAPQLVTWLNQERWKDVTRDRSDDAGRG